MAQLDAAYTGTQEGANVPRNAFSFLGQLAREFHIPQGVKATGRAGRRSGRYRAIERVLNHLLQGGSQ